jgi:hypothetical protein
MTRREAINFLKGYLDEEVYTEKCRNAHEMAIKALEQEPKIGHWIATYGNVKCSVCGSVKDSREVGRATHYCDFCGAKMESEDKE